MYSYLSAVYASSASLSNGIGNSVFCALFSSFFVVNRLEESFHILRDHYSVLHRFWKAPTAKLDSLQPANQRSCRMIGKALYHCPRSHPPTWHPTRTLLSHGFVLLANRCPSYLLSYSRLVIADRNKISSIDEAQSRQ